MKEKDRLLLCMQRFDSYNDSINNKGAVYLALGTFILAGLIGFIPHVKNVLDESLALHFMYICSFLIGLGCLVVTLIAIAPYLTKETNSNYYFNAIAGRSLGVFCQDSENADSSKLGDLRSQIHELATGLRRKFKLMHYAFRLFLIQFALLTITAILIAYNI